MKLSEREQYIIKQYEQDEEMMILLFAQWCVNNDLNAHQLYGRAYPHQLENKALQAALDQTVPKDESEAISKNLIIAVLQAFGNDDLAFEVEQVKVKTE